MSNKEKAIEISERVLKEHKNEPMCISEIWHFARENGYISEIPYDTKTPEKSFTSDVNCYKLEENSIFEVVGKRKSKITNREGFVIRLKDVNLDKTSKNGGGGKSKKAILTKQICIYT